MSSTLSSVRSSPIPDLAYDSYRSLTLRDQTLMRNVPGPPPPPSIQEYNSTISESPQPARNSEMSYNISSSSHPELLMPTTLRSRPVSHAPQGSPSPNLRTTSAQDPLVKRRPSSFFVPHSQEKAYDLRGYNAEALAFWILLGVLSLLVIANTILTSILFGVVRVGAGTEAIEFLPRLLKFRGNTDLDVIYKRDGILQGFGNEPMEISGEEGGEVQLRVWDGAQPLLSVEKGAINISSVEEFLIKDKRGNEIFSTNTPTLGLPRGVQKLDVRVAKVNRITAGVNASLQLVSHSLTYLQGSEGTRIEGKQISFKADQDIHLKTVKGNLIISGREGIFVNVHDLPLVRESDVRRKSHTYTTHGKKEPQYQLCICMPEGKLFRVAIPVNNLSRPKRDRVGCHTPRNPPC